jgi:uncharacterized membrane protein (DUF2068 family)
MSPRHGHLPKDVYGLRSIAVTEFLKGAGAVGAAVLLLLHPHASYGHLAERILRAFHIHRNSDLALEVVSWARRIDVHHVHIAVAFAFVYAALRFAEGWGLWRVKTWAEWFGFLNGALYLPIELVEIARHFTYLKLAILVINIIVVLYLAWEIRKGRREKALQEAERLEVAPDLAHHS